MELLIVALICLSLPVYLLVRDYIDTRDYQEACNQEKRALQKAVITYMSQPQPQTDYDRLLAYYHKKYHKEELDPEFYKSSKDDILMLKLSERIYFFTPEGVVFEHLVNPLKLHYFVKFRYILKMLRENQ